MKKTFTLSISGRLFNVEEDAYALLLDYIDSLSQMLKGEDGREIVNDIEARISELFQEKANNGKIVFTVADVNEVIAVMGNANEIADATDEKQADPEENMKSENPQPSAIPGYCPPPAAPAHRKFYRSQRNRVLGGVLGGLAIRFDFSATALRLIVVLVGFCIGLFPMFLAYCIVWACTPLADTPERILEQEGKPITVVNIGEVLSAQASCPPPATNSFSSVLGALIMGFFGIIAAGLGVGTLTGFIFLTILAISALTHPTSCLMLFTNADTSHLLTDPMTSSLTFMAAALVCLAILIPCIATVWAAATVLFKAKSAGRKIWITAIAIEIFAIIAISVLIAIL